MSDPTESTDNPPHVAHAAPPDPREVLPPIWVIYEDPTDYPHAFVVRVWHGLHPAREAHVCRTLAEARRYVADQGAAVKMERSDKDPHVIREAWI